MSGNKFKIPCFIFSILLLAPICFAEEIKEPNVAGAFYPDNKAQLSEMIGRYLEAANPQPIDGEIFALISPHAGYGYSGQTAAFGYELIRNNPYKTVIIIGPSHHYAFSGVSVFPEGKFRTPLGDIEIDSAFAEKLLKAGDGEIVFAREAFSKEHSVEVQLPFLQKVLKDFKIVPVVMGDCSLEECKKFVQALKQAIASRKDVLLVISSDFYHGYDWEECAQVDSVTLDYIKNMNAEGLYYGLRENKAQACGGFGIVSGLILAKELGHNKVKVLNTTNSASVTGKKEKGTWAVGYASIAVDKEGEKAMLSKEQRKKLLGIARSSIGEYLSKGERLKVTESDPVLTKPMGAFVTLTEHGSLRGCIGNLVAKAPLYLTIRDMAVEAATQDPRFAPVSLAELKDIEIEISVLSPMQRVDSAEEIELGKHGVLVRRGYNSGVFLPQVATETGWSKEEFLSQLCAQKAGLPADAWKDKSTELYVFTAEVFSEKHY